MSPLLKIFNSYINYFRSYSGNFLHGFSANLGCCNYSGGSVGDIHWASTFLPDIYAVKELLSGDWFIHLSHILREANSCADSFARQGHMLELKVVWFNALPSFASLYSFSSELIGICFPKIVALQFSFELFSLLVNK